MARNRDYANMLKQAAAAEGVPNEEVVADEIPAEGIVAEENAQVPEEVAAETVIPEITEDASNEEADLGNSENPEPEAAPEVVAEVPASVIETPAEEVIEPVVIPEPVVVVPAKEAITVTACRRYLEAFKKAMSKPNLQRTAEDTRAGSRALLDAFKYAMRPESGNEGFDLILAFFHEEKDGLMQEHLALRGAEVHALGQRNMLDAMYIAFREMSVNPRKRTFSIEKLHAMTGSESLRNYVARKMPE